LTAAPTAFGTGFDPGNNRPCIVGIVVAWGRDAADVPLIRAFGPHVPVAFEVWEDEAVQVGGAGGGGGVRFGRRAAIRCASHE